MKTFYPVIFLLLFFSSFSHGQTISESLINLRKKYNPLFDSKTSVLTIDYVREFQINKQDTSFYMVIKVNNANVEQESFSIGTSIFGSIAGGGTYKVDRKEGETKFNKEDLLEFYDCANNIYKFISSHNFTKEGFNTVASCEIQNIRIGAELVYNSGGKEIKYYFKLGDEAVFQMEKVEFEDIMRIIGQIKKDWEKR